MDAIAGAVAACPVIELLLSESELQPASAAKLSASGKTNPLHVSRIALVSSCCRGRDGRRFVSGSIRFKPVARSAIE
jgi:hypothetical protein